MEDGKMEGEEKNWSRGNNALNSWLHVQHLWLKRRVGKYLCDLVEYSISQLPVLGT